MPIGRINKTFYTPDGRRWRSFGLAAIPYSHINYVYALTDSVFAQVAQLYFRIIDIHSPLFQRIMSFEYKRLNLQEGQYFPKTSLFFWLCLPYAIVAKFCEKINTDSIINEI